jgi:parallel beta helix pectate lyase-like protein
MRGCLVALTASLLLASSAEARTWVTAMNGTDGPSCGTAAAPCRSISASIANASDGDTIVVGPGFYGNLNGDGDYADPGDEAGSPGSGCVCVIPIQKRVKVKSRDGADATVIEGGTVARGVWFGPGSAGSSFSGFTINGAAVALYADTGAQNVVLSANVVRGGSGDGVGVFNGASATLSSIHAIGRGGSGFNFSENVTLTDCIAQSNGNYGFYSAPGALVARKSVAVANGAFGFMTALGSGDMKSVSSLANLGGGIEFNSSTGSLKSSTIMGNTRFVQCGVGSYGGADFPATGNFWGGPEGPGVAPSDALCTASNPLDAIPFKTTEIRVMPKAIK